MREIKEVENAEEILRIKKPATEETLQSIASTLERIEIMLIQYLPQVKSISREEFMKGWTDEKERDAIRGLTIEIND